MGHGRSTWLHFFGFFISPLPFLVRLLPIMRPVWFRLLYCLLFTPSCMLSKWAWLPVVFGIRFLCGMKFMAVVGASAVSWVGGRCCSW